MFGDYREKSYFCSQKPYGHSNSAYFLLSCLSCFSAVSKTNLLI